MMPRRAAITTAILVTVLCISGCSPVQVQNWFSSRGVALDEPAVATLVAYRTPTPLPPQTCTEAVNALWPESSKAWAHRIVKRESGGNASAKNRSSSASGCFQILSMHSAKFTQVGCTWSTGRFNAVCNTKVALVLFQQSGKDPWGFR